MPVRLQRDGRERGEAELKCKKYGYVFVVEQCLEHYWRDIPAIGRVRNESTFA